MAAETTTGFEIDGTMYPVPFIDSFTMDEAQVLYDYTGLTVEDFVVDDASGPDADERTKNLLNPGVLRTLMHIAYQRGNPKLSAAKVKAAVGSVNVVTAYSNFFDATGAEEDAVPLASTTEPVEQSLSVPVISSVSSGPGSRNASAEQDASLQATGAGR